MCKRRSLGHCFYVYTLSEPVTSTWLHPLDREVSPPTRSRASYATRPQLTRIHPLPQADAALATTAGASISDAEGYLHHATLGTKLKNLTTGKSHEERAQQRAAKHKLVSRVDAV